MQDVSPIEYLFREVLPQAGQTQICPGFASNGAMKAAHSASDMALAGIVTEKYITSARAPSILPAVGWAAVHIEMLKAGYPVKFRPRGSSMEPLVPDNALCTVEPVNYKTLKTGDIVLCKVKGNEYLHLVKDVRGLQFQIGNNKGCINGWASPGMIYGKLMKVEP